MDDKVGKRIRHADRVSGESIRQLFDLPRFQRYQLAGKGLRFVIYQRIELYVAISGAIAVLGTILESPALAQVIRVNAFFVAIAAIGHHASLVVNRPYLILAAAFEAWVVWALHHWLLRDYFDPSDSWTLAVFVFVWRFWKRGEDVVNALARDAVAQEEVSVAHAATKGPLK